MRPLPEAAGAREVQSSPRSSVWRLEYGGAAVVVKQATGGDDAQARFEREITALTLAARSGGVPPVARVIASDAGCRVMVLEHLAEAPAPADWAVRYTDALARLHAATGPADAGALPRWQGPTEADAEAFAGFAGALGVPVPARARAEISALVERLGAGDHHALLHGDPCPDNVIVTRQGLRFVDLEQASLGNGLMELAYLRTGFPTCWCALGIAPAMLAEAERRYRAIWRVLTGTDVQGRLADACAGWLLRGDALVERARRHTTDHLAAVLRDDWSWGVAGARERLAHRLGVVAAAEEPDLAALAALAGAVRERMLTRWPGLAPLPPTRP
ncbi:aminoglycoside phosphotransferase [Spongiactinospora gelatinilytica]|uniref:Aminoglycoside phosphotransferase n=1 Tax=Spongiactinospora gelatinilytica TaxID=2666298 RepID=A0A2W2GB90_9ACTN|nr:aminoglycoside phosphotransferase family protein [Spongiactinospora gelatinilytica]PZG45681.1 aminoglycoside phosphotransferase [Spongiactinospora gelatinilytica]